MRTTTLIAYLCLWNATSQAEIDFNRDILPVLSEKCFACHGPDANTREADLRLDTLEGATRDLGGYSALVPGDVQSSELLNRINDEDALMPPPESKLKLSDKEKLLLKQWVISGAEYAPHWSFVAPQRPEVPNGEFGSNPIDAFIGQRLQKEGLQFSPEASPEKLIRRVTLDLTGLPPTVEEVDNFVAAYADRGEAAWEELVDRLLKSPRYGETMALPWLEAARFADTDGYQFDGPRYQWRWRDWVIDAYNAHMPFDQFTIEQLAGDLLPDATIEQNIATGFNRNHRYNSEAGLVVEEFLLENAVDRVDTTSTLWMGLTMGCARCHDHKYDPISQRDYYQLISFFNNVPEAGRAIKEGNSEPVVLAPTKLQQVEWEQKKQAVEAARQALKPGDTPQQGGLLIDRRMANHFKLDVLPDIPKMISGKPIVQDQSILFDGDSTVQLGEIDKALSFRANTAFSISFWLRCDDLRDSIILSRQQPGTTRPGVELALVEGGRLRFDLITRWMAGVGRATTDMHLPKGEWVHIAVTNDASQSANGQRIFINGQPVETTVTHNTNSNVGGVKAERPLMLGGGIAPASKNFVGAMRDVRLYKTDLWDEEIEILAATYGGPERQEFSRIKMTDEYKQYVKLREELEKFEDSLPTVMVMRDMAEPKPTFIRKRGVYNSFGEEVGRGVPESMPPMDASLPKNRLGFAKWLVSPDHPLTSRVAVNRYWQRYFGTGLVKTSEDFGVQGEMPSHPELLDWLATEFVRSGWDVAGMQKLIVSSRTYRQDSRVTPKLLERDPENRWLARGPRLRLSAQVIRDQALFASGLLVERIGGPSVSPYQPENLWAEMSMGMRYKQSKGEDLYRRSLYTIWKRTVAPPSMSTFDAADRESCWVKRKETNTPLQALTLLNETGYVESARHLAARMIREGGDDPIGFGFRSLTARYPDAQERSVLESALGEYRKAFSSDSELAAQIVAVGDSPADAKIDAQRLAEFTALANVLLNLDEAITKE